MPRCEDSRPSISKDKNLCIRTRLPQPEIRYILWARILQHGTSGMFTPVHPPRPGHAPYRALDAFRSSRAIIFFSRRIFDGDLRPLEHLREAYDYTAGFLNAWLRAFLRRTRRLFLPLTATAPAAPSAPQADDWDDAGHHEEVAFTLAVIALAARLINADGGESQREYKAFLQAFPMPNSESNKIRRLYNAACRDKTPAAFYARHIAGLYPGKQELFCQLLRRLFQVAAADGPINLREFRFLREVAQALSLSDAAIRRIGEEVLRREDEDPHALLGVPKDCDAIRLKQSYHAALRACHPDRVAASLAEARDAMEESWISLMSQQAVAVNAAYTQLKAVAR